ncbi:MAG: 50S ribosome-binding GTPase [Fimbriimonadaceae bacterium]|nr:50S ribosome-binding GTPase [Fimbriimonadaceae bacterium]
MSRLQTDLAPEPLAGGLREWSSDGPVAALDGVLAELDSWLAATSLLPDEETRRRLREQAALVAERREHLLSPLLIAIIGGTGVGKSTLLNALAGREVALASARRPCTQEVTVYHHAADALALDPALASTAQRVEHRREELRDKLLIDTPDYDSTDLAHRRRMQEVLQVADVVIFVTTAEKYADLAGTAWLQRFAAGRQYLFVLNRADENPGPEIVADYRTRLATLGFADPRVMLLSARDAAAAKQSLADLPSGFADLERVLADELDTKRRRALKEANLGELVRRLLRLVAAAVPADLAERLESWQAAGEAAYGTLRRDLAERLYPRLLGDARLAHHIEYWFGTGFGGPVGALLTLVYGLRAALSPVYPRLWELSEAPDLGLLDSDEEADRVAARVAATGARLRALAVEAGLPAGADALPQESELVSRTLAQKVDDRLRQALGRQVRAARGSTPLGARLFSLLLNVPVTVALLAAPAWFLWDRLGALLGQPVLPGGAYWQAVGLVLALYLGAAMLLAQWAVRRRSRYFLQDLREMVGHGLDEVFRHRLLGRLGDHLTRLRAERAALTALAQQVH